MGNFDLQVHQPPASAAGWRPGCDGRNGNGAGRTRTAAADGPALQLCSLCELRKMPQSAFSGRLWYALRDRCLGDQNSLFNVFINYLDDVTHCPCRHIREKKLTLWGTAVMEGATWQSKTQNSWNSTKTVLKSCTCKELRLLDGEEKKKQNTWEPWGQPIVCKSAMNLWHQWRTTTPWSGSLSTSVASRLIPEQISGIKWFFSAQPLWEHMWILCPVWG